MKNIREAVRNVIEQRILPWIQRDGISNLLLPEQITPDHCATPMKCPRPCYLRHREPQLVIGLTGKAPYCIDGKTFIFTRGRMVLLPAGTPHSPSQRTIRFTEEINLDRPASSLWLMSYPSGVRLQALRVIGKRDVLEATHHYLLLDRHFGRLMTCLAEEVRSGLPNYAGVGQGILIEFMHRCLRAIGDAGVGRPPRTLTKGRSSVKAGSKPLPAPVRAALEFIDSHYHAPLSLDDIAEASEASVTHLHRQFKDAVGVTPIQYLTNVRMEAAKELLLTDLNIGEVASLIGIGDISYFGRVFRRNTGVNPRQYRKKAVKASRYRPPPAG